MFGFSSVADNYFVQFETDDEFDAFVDYPIHAIYQKLYDDNNDAKFILTYRPPHDVALSWLRMMQHKQVVQRQQISYQVIRARKLRGKI